MCPPDDFFEQIIHDRQPVSDPVSQRRLCETVLAQTIGVVRNRRRIRRAGIAAALVGCYLAGMATISLWRSASSIDAASSGAGLAQRIGPSTDGNNVEPVRKPVRPEDDQVVDSQMQLAATKLTPYDRLRRVGDRLLEENGDIPAAMRSYKRALQVASADQRSLAPDQDSWLLMAVKNSSHEN